MVKQGQAIPEHVQSSEVNTAILHGTKKGAVSLAVSGTRETEVKEKGEGSLSTFIVLIKTGKSAP